MNNNASSGKNFKKITLPIYNLTKSDVLFKKKNIVKENDDYILRLLSTKSNFKNKFN